SDLSQGVDGEWVPWTPGPVPLNFSSLPAVHVELAGWYPNHHGGSPPPTWWKQPAAFDPPHAACKANPSYWPYNPLHPLPWQPPLDLPPKDGPAPLFK